MSKVKFLGLGVLVGLAMVVLMGVNLKVGGCEDVYPTSTAFDEYFFAGGKVVDWQFEPDKDGAGTTAVIQFYSCTEQDEESCVLYSYDTDYDGVPDSTTSDGVSAGERGQSFLGIAGFLRITVDTAPLTTEDAMIWVCAGES